MRTRYITVLFLLIIAIAAFFRIASLKTIPPGLYPDEAMNESNALESLENGGVFSGGKFFYPENNGREGLFINIQGLFLEYFLSEHAHPEPWMLRLPSALFGILTVIGIFLFTRELFYQENKKRATYIALIAAFFLASSVWHIIFSRIGFRAITAPCYLLWGLWLLLLVIRKQRKVNEIKESSKYTNWFLTLLAGAIYGLGMHSYIAYRATPLLIFFIFLSLVKKSKKEFIFRTAILFCLGAIIISSPLIVYFWNHPTDFFGRTTQVSVFSTPNPIYQIATNSLKTVGMFFWKGDENWRHNLSGDPELFFPVAFLFLFGLCLAVSNFRKKGENSFQSIILLSWIFVGAAPVVISSESIPHALRSILLIPPAMICAAWGAQILFEWFEKKNIHPTPPKILAVLFFLSLIIHAYHTYFIEWGKRKETADAFATNYVNMAKTINSLPQEIPKYIVIKTNGVDVRGYPMPTQTIMFLTQSFLPEEQTKRNIHYIFPENIKIIPENAAVFTLQ